MSRRIPVIVLLAALALTIGCTNKKVNNPLANVGSKQPDKVLFDKAGHYPFLEHADKFNSLVLEFLKSPS